MDRVYKRTMRRAQFLQFRSELSIGENVSAAVESAVKIKMRTIKTFVTILVLCIISHSKGFEAVTDDAVIIEGATRQIK